MTDIVYYKMPKDLSYFPQTMISEIDECSKSEWTEIVITDSHDLFCKKKFPGLLLSDDYKRVLEIAFAIRTCKEKVLYEVYDKGKNILKSEIPDGKTLINLLELHEKKKSDWCVMFYEASEISKFIYASFHENIHLFVKSDKCKSVLSRLDDFAEETTYAQYELGTEDEPNEQ